MVKKTAATLGGLQVSDCAFASIGGRKQQTQETKFHAQIERRRPVSLLSPTPIGEPLSNDYIG